MPKISRCAIMILNWNGIKWLKQCLPSVVESAKVNNSEVWIVDNDSTDESHSFVSKNFKNVKFFSTGGNYVLCGYYNAALACDCEYLLFLNNDIIPDKNFIEPLLSAMYADENVFSAASQVRGFPVSESAPVELAASFPTWSLGMLRGSVTYPTERIETWYPAGCSMICRRSFFLELGGFDPLYLPGYHEDVDIAWQAWKRGWSSLYEPSSLVYHAGGGSFGRSEKVKVLALRNEFLFHWKNISNPAWRKEHFRTIVPRLINAGYKKDYARLKGFSSALSKYKGRFSEYKIKMKDYTLDDLEILQRIQSQHKYLLKK